MNAKLARGIGATLALGLVGLLIWGVQAGGSNTRTYRGPGGVWEISYPSNFQIGPLHGGDARFSVDGIWISNFGQPRADQSEVTPVRRRPTGGPRQL